MAGTIMIDGSVVYGDPDYLNIIDNLGVKNLVAMKDETTLLDQNLFLGASKDVVMQANEGMVINLGSSNQLVVNDSSGVESLKVITDPNTTHTTITTIQKDMKLTTTDNSNLSIHVGYATVSQSNNYQNINTSMPSGFLLDKGVRTTGNTLVEKSMAVAENIVCSHSMFGKDYNLIKHMTPSSSPTKPKMVGFSFAINTSNQLELLKHALFNNGGKVTKRVGIFGLNTLTGADSIYDNFGDVVTANNYFNPTTNTTTNANVEVMVSGSASAGATNVFLYGLQTYLEPYGEYFPITSTTYSNDRYNLAESIDTAFLNDDNNLNVSERMSFDFYFMGDNYSNSSANKAIYFQTNGVLMFIIENEYVWSPLYGDDYTSASQNGKCIRLGNHDRVAGHISVSPTQTTADGVQYVVMLYEAGNYLDPQPWTRSSLSALQWRIVLARDANYQYIEIRSNSNPVPGFSTGKFDISDGTNFIDVFGINSGGRFSPSTFTSFVLRSNLLGQDWALFDVYHLNLPTPMPAYPELTLEPTTTSIAITSYVSGIRFELPLDNNLVWTVKSNGGTSASVETVNGDYVLWYYSLGSSGTRTIELYKSFSPEIMSSTGLIPVVSTILVTETFVNPILVTDSFITTIATRTSGQEFTYELPSTNNGLPFVWTIKSQGGTGAVLVGNILFYYSAGSSTAYTIELYKSYSPEIMTATGLMPIVETLNVTETLVFEYPPTMLTGYSTTKTGEPYGNGTYIVSSSSEYTYYGAEHFNWKAFTKDWTLYGDWWSTGSETARYSNEGFYIFNTTTNVAGTDVLGEWLQIQFPENISIASYDVYPRQDSFYQVTKYSPSKWTLAGSTDGTTWSLVHSVSSYSWPSTGTLGSIVLSNNVSDTNSYCYYRFIAEVVGDATGDNQTCHIAELMFFAR